MQEEETRVYVQAGSIINKNVCKSKTVNQPDRLLACPPSTAAAMALPCCVALSTLDMAS